MTEAGILPGRTEFTRESARGETPANPAFKSYSDAVQAFEPAINPQTAARGALGNADNEASHVTVEGSTLTVTYDLQRWLVDGGGAPLDAAYDGIARDAANRLPNTHTVVRRTEQFGLAAENTLSGNTSRDRRNYFVGRGGRISDVTISLAPGDTPVWQVEVTYQFERARRHVFDQPASGTLLVVRSTDAGDTTQTLTIEDEGAGTTEDVPLDGTNLVSTSATFADIDAAELDAQTDGDVIVAVNSGSATTPAEGDQLGELTGALAYQHGEGDIGVPALGTGSHEGDIGTGYELAFDGDTLERPAGTAIAENVGTHEVAVSNNVEPGARGTTPFPSLEEGAREITVSSTVWGEAERRDRIIDMLQAGANDYVWTPASGDSLTVEQMKQTEVAAAEEVGQGRLEIDVTFSQQEGVVVA